MIKHDLKHQLSLDDENSERTRRSRTPGSTRNVGEGRQSMILPYQAPTISFLQKCSLEKKTKRTPREEDNELPPVMVPSRLSSAAQRDAERKSCKMCKWICEEFNSMDYFLILCFTLQLSGHKPTEQRRVTQWHSTITTRRTGRSLRTKYHWTTNI